MYFDPLYFLLAMPGMLLAMFAQWRVKSTFGKYSQVGTRRGLTGAQVAQQILDVRGIRDVRIESVNGFLSDHYDPTQKVLRLSPDVYGGRSVAAVGVAAHEVGHAIQHATAYRWLTMRSQIVPVVGVLNNLATPMFFGGMILSSIGMAGLGIPVMQLGAVAFLGLVVFQLITLPVEFDASARAMVAIEDGALLTGDEADGARRVLNAAALTYVAAAISALLNFLYFAIRSGLIGGRDD